MSAVCSFSQELVQPPDNPAGGAVWVHASPTARRWRRPRSGFGALNSSQIAFSSGPQSYMGQAYAAMAGLMLAAGLTPKLQFGEILWWFLANASGMAFHDADTQPAAQSVLGRALATFHTPNDDPSVNGYADANFLRTRLYNYVAAIQSYVLSQCPSAVFELLWPMDVNDIIDLLADSCRNYAWLITNGAPYHTAWEQYLKNLDLPALIAAIACIYCHRSDLRAFGSRDRSPSGCEAGYRPGAPGGNSERCTLVISPRSARNRPSVSTVQIEPRRSPTNRGHRQRQADPGGRKPATSTRCLHCGNCRSRVSESVVIWANRSA